MSAQKYAINSAAFSEVCVPPHHFQQSFTDCSLRWKDDQRVKHIVEPPTGLITVARPRPPLTLHCAQPVQQFDRSSRQIPGTLSDVFDTYPDFHACLDLSSRGKAAE